MKNIKNLTEKYVDALERYNALRDSLNEANHKIVALQSDLAEARANIARLQARLWAIKIVSVIIVVSILIWRLT